MVDTNVDTDPERIGAWLLALALLGVVLVPVAAHGWQTAATAASGLDDGSAPVEGGEPAVTDDANADDAKVGDEPPSGSEATSGNETTTSNGSDSGEATAGDGRDGGRSERTPENRSLGNETGHAERIEVTAIARCNATDSTPARESAASSGVEGTETAERVPPGTRVIQAFSGFAMVFSLGALVAAIMAYRGTD